ncbi:helix-turn-helix transcriptional regulator [Subtercola lobariae]|uniref:Transcriptional regulator n=1 Tax=Subtercola lobariae TaxID=1588641 RepID=A0A917EWD9_9MICO|nr:helix-turn-helix transcriptional regulator [Subtercola lobariae]GGF21527.1 transcriptional regulator [Subtercola lobariae]
MVNQPELADFLRKRREALQPEDVGLTRGPRRRTSGLRREEVAELAGMSTDYYARLERGNGPQPSEQMAAAIARGLRLSLAERDHLFMLTGHGAPQRVRRTDHISPGLMRVLDRLDDTPAQIMSNLGETLVQTPLAVALLGEQTHFAGASRINVYRWFTDPSSREMYEPDDFELHGRVFAAQFRQVVAQQGPGSQAAALAESLLQQSDEFAAVWHDHEIGLVYTEQKRFVNPEVGPMLLHCQLLLDPDQQQSLLVITATPGTESYERLQLLSVIGSQKLGLPAR